MKKLVSMLVLLNCVVAVSYARTTRECLEINEKCVGFPYMKQVKEGKGIGEMKETTCEKIHEECMREALATQPEALAGKCLDCLEEAPIPTQSMPMIKSMPPIEVQSDKLFVVQPARLGNTMERIDNGTHCFYKNN